MLRTVTRIQSRKLKTSSMFGSMVETVTGCQGKLLKRFEKKCYIFNQIKDLKFKSTLQFL